VRDVLVPLSLMGFGSIESLRNLPLSLLNRLIFIMDDEDMVKRYWSFKSYNYASGKNKDE